MIVWLFVVAHVLVAHCFEFPLNPFANTAARLAETIDPVKCASCTAFVKVLKHAADRSPQAVVNLLDASCAKGPLAGHSLCPSDHSVYSDASKLRNGFSFLPDLLNTLKLMDTDSLDPQYFCHYMMQGACPVPELPEIDFEELLPARLDSSRALPTSQGKSFKVLHVSDIHLSINYTVGAAAECVGFMCCTPESVPDPALEFVAAPPFGHFRCDTPPRLMDSSLEAAAAMHDYEFAIFTGDMVDHDPVLISRDQMELEEVEVMKALKRSLGDVPVFATLGNHDSYPFSQAPPVGSVYAQRFSYNVELMEHLWSDYGWLDQRTARQARRHHGAFSVLVKPKLKVISLNSNFWYRWNFYNFANTEDPHASGLMQFLIDELHAAERHGQKVWIIGHVPPGGLAEETLPIASQFLNAIFERFSANIAALFFGHTHMDEFTVQYAGGIKDLDHALLTAYIAPSVTPLENFNPSWRYYEVDAHTFEIKDAVTYYSDLGDGQSLDWQKYYSAREVYGPLVGLEANETLSASFWHKVAVQIRDDPEVASLYSQLSFRGTQFAPECRDEACRTEQWCYSTSMSADQAFQCREGRVALHGIPQFPMLRPHRHALHRH